MKDVGGAAGAGGSDDAAGVNDVVREHEGGRGALRRWRPWPKIAFVVIELWSATRNGRADAIKIKKKTAAE